MKKEKTIKKAKQKQNKGIMNGQNCGNIWEKILVAKEWQIITKNPWSLYVEKQSN